MAGFFPFFPPIVTATSGHGTQNLDASNDGAAVVFRSPKAGNITKVGLSVTSLTGTSPTYTIGIEGGSGFYPDGTVKGGGSPASVSQALSVGTQWYTLDNAYTASLGEFLTATVRHSSGTVDASNFAQVRTGSAGGSNFKGFPIAATLTGGTWARVQNLVPSITVEYADGYVLDGTMLVTASPSNVSWNSGDSPRYRGIKWVPPVGGTMRGVYLSVYANLGPTGDFDVLVYKNGATSAEESISVDVSEQYPPDNNWYTLQLPLPGISFSANDEIRMVVNPTTVNDISLGIPQQKFLDAATLDVIFPNGCYTEASSPGTWTDYDNVSDGFWGFAMGPMAVPVVGSSGLLYTPPFTTIGL